MLSALPRQDGVLAVGVGVSLVMGFQLVGALCLMLDCIRP
jgi:hypothetical protein